MAKKIGLGRGLDSIISENANPELAAANNEENKTGEVLVNINLIDPNRQQPRKQFNKEKLQELSDSIKQYGIVEPLVLKKNGNRYEIIAGERRWRAAKMAKLKEVPAVIKDYTEQEKFEIAIIENIQREDLNAIEEAKAYESLITEYGLTQDGLAARISKSRVAITNALRLLKLDERVQELVIEELISGGHARALLGIEDGDLQFQLAERVCKEKLSVRDIERIVRNLTEKKPAEKQKKKPLANEAIYNEYAANLISLIGSKVEIQRNDENKGKIVIDYNSTEEFEKIYEIIIKGGKQ